MTTLIQNFSSLSFQDLLDEIEFEQRSVRVFGKEYPQPRLTAWYGPIEYTYSNLTWDKRALTPLLKRLQEEIQEHTGIFFPTVLANLYRDGGDKVGWHSDDEPTFGKDPIIASLSFGATRTFKMRRKADHQDKQDFELSDGSLLIMPKGTQPAWEHSVPVRKRVKEPRINLTFRTLP